MSDDKPKALGWMVSEIYEMVRKIDQARTQADEKAAEPRKTINEQVAYLEGRLQTADARTEFLDAEVEALRRKVEAVVAERDELLHQRDQAIPITNEPMLGLATTEDLFRELISRFGNWQASQYYTNIDRVVILAEMLGGMSATEREYRSIDD